MAKTNRPMVRIHNLETDEIIDREMNDAEFTAWQAEQAAAAAMAAEQEAAAAKKAAILDALATATGYTVDELRDALNA